ncbi:hypothetical protein LTR95_001932 [Oleoguttula sp. CCFEE 5521]
MLNHSCRPNATVYCDDGGTRRTYAHQDIKRGEEITANYGEEFVYLSYEERKAYLETFDCLCELCTAPPAERDISDSRRLMFRALRYGFEDRENTNDDASFVEGY